MGVIEIVLSIVSFVLFLALVLLVKYERQVVFLRALLIKQKESTQQAERKNMNKSLAFANASHDIRTSLAIITGLIDLCYCEVAQGSELHKKLGQMNVCASKLLGLLNSVLDTSKIDAGKMQLEEVEFDMAQVLEESVDFFHVVSLKKSLEVIWDPCDNSVLKQLNVKGDCKRLKQILDNLLGNAVKFTSEGHVVLRAWANKPTLKRSTLSSNHGCLSELFHKSLLSQMFHKCVSFYNDESSLHSVQSDFNSIEFTFEIDDTGIGIPKEKRASIFENYVQVKEESGFGGHEGTGLGLGIVQSIVRLMGGEICIVDKEPGHKGTCFRFNIFLRSLEPYEALKEEDIILHVDQAANDLRKTAVTSSIGGIQNFGSHTLIHSHNRVMAFREGLKQEGINVVLLFQSEELRRIAKNWVESLGIKVWPVCYWENLNPTLEKLKQILFPYHFTASGKYDTSPFNLSLSRSASSHSVGGEIKVSTGPKDGYDPNIHSNVTIRGSYRNTSFKSSSTYVLVLIDISYGPFLETCSILKKFVGGISNHQYKIIWLVNPNTPINQLRSLENKQVPCDMLLKKPFHGSRLHTILCLLQDLGGVKDNLLTKTEVVVPEVQHSIEAGPSTGTNQLSTTAEPNNLIQQRGGLKFDMNGKKPLTGMNILVVEDNKMMLKLTSTTLSLFGATCECSENGNEALNLVRKALRQMVVPTSTQRSEDVSKRFLYDVIIMDCEMPIMNGYEATRQIRIEEKQYGLRIPIIALSAHAMIEEETKSIMAGMNLHLTKPYKANLLLNAILMVNQN